MKMPGSMQNMQKMMQQAQKMQEQVQQQISEIRVEASTGGGIVSVKMDGNKHLLEVSIDPTAMEDREMLQDMLLELPQEIE